jgi:hypothetical protein
MASQFIADAKARAYGPAKPAYDPWADVQKAQDYTKQSVTANAELLRPELLGRIGDTLGGLNSIGALRSGGTRVALGDLNREFTDRIGNIASAATLQGANIGLGVGGQRLQSRSLDFQQEQIKAQRRSALLGAIGNIVGAGIGFAVGGPPGAVAGATVGGKVG